MGDALPFYKEANSIYRMTTLKNPAAVDVYLYRVMCLKDMEQYDKALELCDFVANISDDIAEVHTLRADIYQALGKNSQAELEREKAYELKPELRPTEEKVGE